MESALAQFRHPLQPGHIFTAANGHHGNGGAFCHQPFQQLRHSFLLVAIIAVGQHDDVTDLVLTLRQSFGSGFQSGAHVDSAAARANLPDPGDNRLFVVGRRRSDHAVRPGVHGNNRNLVEIVQ